MLFNKKSFEFEIDGRKCEFSSGVLARSSNAAVLAKMGDTVILATVNIGEAKSDSDFFPLSVEYIEKLYAAGKISGSRFVKRERFPSNDAVLNARMIDRSVRSKFPADYRNEVSIIVTVLSFDPNSDPMLLAVNAASAALMISSVPFDGPVSGVRIGLKDSTPMTLYSHVDSDNESEQTKMNYVVSGDGELFTMIDADASEVAEDTIIEGMKLGLEAMKPWIEAQNSYAKLFEVEKMEYTSFAIPDELVKGIQDLVGVEISANMSTSAPEEKDPEILARVFEKYEGQYSKVMLKEAYFKVAKKELRTLVVKDGKRVDGRPFDQVRELGFEVGVLPRVHGSGLFSRGLTQVLTIATLGSTRSQLIVDDMTGENERNYMHFYNAMPFSYGTAERVKYMPGRREIGHGALAEKALAPVLPTMAEFPYTKLLMSEIMSQQGSSSMASVCASTLALMDAGVPIKRPVAGIAMGVVTTDDGDYKVLTDIIDLEDFYGDMDFKVAGTTEGVTAVQMDNKNAGLPLEIFEVAIKQAKAARVHIIDEMVKVMDKPREKLSEFAPKVAQVKIPVDKIGELIGPGGKNIKMIIEDTGTDINIEEDGTVQIFGMDADKIEQAKGIVASYAFEPVVGDIYEGEVVGITNFGAFVEIARGVSGLVHVSEMAEGFVKDVRDHVKEGEIVKVKVMGVEEGSGKIKLSMKAAAPKSSAPAVEKKSSERYEE